MRAACQVERGLSRFSYMGTSDGPARSVRVRVRVRMRVSSPSAGHALMPGQTGRHGAPPPCPRSLKLTYAAVDRVASVRARATAATVFPTLAALGDSGISVPVPPTSDVLALAENVLAPLACAAPEVDGVPVPFPFVGGWVGYLGYELGLEAHGPRGAAVDAAGLVGGAAEAASNLPTVGLLFADRLLAFDHDDRAVYAVFLTHPSLPALATINEAWVEDMRARFGAAAALAATRSATVAGGTEPGALAVDREGTATRRRRPLRLNLTDLADAHAMVGDSTLATQPSACSVTRWRPSFGRSGSMMAAAARGSERPAPCTPPPFARRCGPSAWARRTKCA